MKEESEKVKVCLKLNIQKTKIMAPGLITSWQVDRETMENVKVYFFGLQNTADDSCSHEIKRHLFLEIKLMTNLGSILKIRDITFPTQVHLVKAMVFLVVMYICKSWTIRRLNAKDFELWCWRRLLRVSWTARRSNPVNPKRNQS